MVEEHPVLGVAGTCYLEATEPFHHFGCSIAGGQLHSSVKVDHFESPDLFGLCSLGR